MSVPKYRLDAIETIGRKILQEYDPVLLDGPPQAVPIETIIETKFDLTLEYDEYMESSFIGMMGAEDETGEEICTGMMM